MPEVVRGSRSNTEEDVRSPISHNGEQQVSQQSTRHAHFDPPTHDSHRSGSAVSVSEGKLRKSFQSRRDSHHAQRPEEPVYYDSRAATKKEFKRRASTLQEYYKQHPMLLPQLPFTWRYGWKRWKLFFTIFLMFTDACAVPIILYYTMTFIGHVQGYIVFAIVATIWGGPTYFEFALRSWRLIKKENFYRPLGTNSRWAFDITHWIFVATIAVVTAELIIGSAPHIVFLRVLSLPGPSIFFVVGLSLLLLTIYNITGRRAPFRISSTPKGGEVYPGAFYLVEDLIAVNANAGRPYREAIAARYAASPRFRKVMLTQSLFWSIPAVIISIGCIVVVCIHQVPKRIAYGIGWGAPFLWAVIWTMITIPWVRREMHKETVMWETDRGIQPLEKATIPMAEKEPEP